MSNNRIICGDATKTLQTLPDCIADLAITDPPYLCRYKDRSGRQLANDSESEAQAVLSALPELYRVLRKDSLCILFCGWTALPQFSRAWTDAGFRTMGQFVWKKSYASSARYVSYHHESAYILAKGNPPKPVEPLDDVRTWTYSGNRNHPTEKAVEVIAPLVRSFSRKGDLVIDPFAGSGSTAVAAALNGRRTIGIGLEACYCDLARQRLDGVQRYLSGKAGGFASEAAPVGLPMTA